MKTLVNGETCYKVLDPIAENEAYRLYECRLPDGKPALLKVAVTVAWNHELQNEAAILEHLQKGADAIDEEARKEYPKRASFGYQKMFMRLVDCFTTEEQGNRAILILDWSKSANRLQDLSPLQHIMSLDHLRIDPKTSVWIMGKLLKLIAFAHDHGVTVNAHGENILINREEHIVTLLDWSASTVPNGFDGTITDDDEDDAVSKAAIEVIRALGGDLETGELPKDPQLESDWYEKLLWEFACGEYESADEAHTYFYDQVRSVWPKGFHKFAGYPVSVGLEEETITEEGA